MITLLLLLLWWVWWGRSPLRFAPFGGGYAPKTAMPQKGQSERGFAPTHSNNNSHHFNNQ
jgi:hypothetical protein